MRASLPDLCLCRAQNAPLGTVCNSAFGDVAEDHELRLGIPVGEYAVRCTLGRVPLHSITQDPLPRTRFVFRARFP